MKALVETRVTGPGGPDRPVPSGHRRYRWSLVRMMLAVAACALLAKAERSGLFWFAASILGATCGAVLTRAMPRLQAFGGVAGGVAVALVFLVEKSVELGFYPDTHQSQYLEFLCLLYAMFGIFVGFLASVIVWILDHSAWLGVRPRRVDRGGSIGGDSVAER